MRRVSLLRAMRIGMNFFPNTDLNEKRLAPLDFLR